VSKLKELEQRLRDEPENLGLRVMVAGAMREVGRQDEAVELYRSVAIAYRDQGRTQQAIAVCRSILEIAPQDDRCHVLLDALAPPPTEPARRSSMEETPLPRPVPYHVADPTTHSVKKQSGIALAGELPLAEGVDTRPGSEDPRSAAVDGIASAARRISASLIDEELAAELDTRQRPRFESSELERILHVPTTVPFERIEIDDDAETPAPRGDDDERTEPRDLLGQARLRVPLRSALASPFFAPLPVDRRAQVAAMFQRKTVPSGAVVIRQGETGHALVLVARGRLDVRAERPDGQLIQVGSIAIGEYVGEAALLQRTPATAHVVAATDADLMLLPARELLELATAYPALWAELKDVGERRRREHDQRLRSR